MAQAKRDENRVPTMLVASNADGVTPVVINVNPSTHVLAVQDGTTGSDFRGAPAVRDQNRVVVLMGISSVDGVTPTPIYGDPGTGEILINST